MLPPRVTYQPIACHLEVFRHRIYAKRTRFKSPFQIQPGGIVAAHTHPLVFTPNK